MTKYLDVERLAREADPEFGNKDGDMPDALVGLDAIRRYTKLVLEEAAKAFSDHDKTGRQWVKGSLWDTLTNEGCARIRALAEGVR